MGCLKEHCDTNLRVESNLRRRIYLTSSGCIFYLDPNWATPFIFHIAYSILFFTIHLSAAIKSTTHIMSEHKASQCVWCAHFWLLAPNSMPYLLERSFVLSFFILLVSPLSFYRLCVFFLLCSLGRCILFFCENGVFSQNNISQALLHGSYSWPADLLHSYLQCIFQEIWIHLK